jgi:hypothetical protein
LIKLGRRQFLKRRDCVRQAVSFGAIHQLGGGAITFAAIFLHGWLQSERASALLRFNGTRTVAEQLALSKRICARRISIELLEKTDFHSNEWFSPKNSFLHVELLKF